MDRFEPIEAAKRFYWWIFAISLVSLATLAILAYIFVGRGEQDAIPEMPADQLAEQVGYEGVFEGERSSRWRTVRDRFAAKNPRCEACGSLDNLNVHHVKPFHLYPELELEESNLLSACREHHFRIAHDPDGPWKPQRPDWKKSNPNVREDMRRWRSEHVE